MTDDEEQGTLEPFETKVSLTELEELKRRGIDVPRFAPIGKTGRHRDLGHYFEAARNKYTPHQGAREMERRRAKSMEFFAKNAELSELSELLDEYEQIISEAGWTSHRFEYGYALRAITPDGAHAYVICQPPEKETGGWLLMHRAQLEQLLQNGG